jgi:hypothetical protein
MSLHAIRADLIQESPEFCWRIVGEEDGKEYTKGFIWNASDGFTALIRYHALILKSIKSAMDAAEWGQQRRERQGAATNALMARAQSEGVQK